MDTSQNSSQKMPKIDPLAGKKSGGSYVSYAYDTVKSIFTHSNSALNNNDNN